MNVYEYMTSSRIAKSVPGRSASCSAHLAFCMRPGVLFFLVMTLLGGCGKEDTPAPTPAAGETSATGSTPLQTGQSSRELRIVALSPALAIILQDLGYRDQIVGRHAYDLALDPSVPSCGEQGTIDYETLVRVDPTHIFVQWGSQPLPPRLLELAATKKWIVKNLNPLSLTEIEDSAREMDEAIFDFATRNLDSPLPGPSGAATPPEHIKPAMPFEDDMHLAWSDRGPMMKAAGRILLISGTKPIGALGPGSFHAQLLQRLGGTPALTTGGPWITLDIEDLNTLAPDGIILFSPRPARSERPEQEASPEQLIALFGRAGELNIPAFRNKRVALIDDPFCLTPSTAMIGVADRITDIVTGWGQGKN